LAAVVALGWLALAPTVFAQTSGAIAAIAGTVKDASGAVLPGVTVETSSPALIEKVRATVTDENGQYRIVNLPVGTYSVTFMLTGFNVTWQASTRSKLDVPAQTLEATLLRPVVVNTPALDCAPCQSDINRG
jgi:hypothetical protein